MCAQFYQAVSGVANSDQTVKADPREESVHEWKKFLIVCNRNHSIFLGKKKILFVFSSFGVMMLLISLDSGVYIYPVSDFKIKSPGLVVIPSYILWGTLSFWSKYCSTAYPAWLDSAFNGGHSHAHLPGGIAGQVDQAKERKRGGSKKHTAKEATEGCSFI